MTDADNKIISQAIAHVRNKSPETLLNSLLPITMNFHPNILINGITTLASIAKSGFYRSQFETQSSNGGMTAYPGGERWIWEKDIFGGAYDTAENSIRPKYGALNYTHDRAGAARRFGSCHFRLRHHLIERTSFCYPDSYFQPEHFAVADPKPLIELAIKNEQGLDPILDNYIEAQVHGTISLKEDVEAIVLDPCYRNTLTQEIAENAGCSLEWHTGFSLK